MLTWRLAEKSQPTQQRNIFFCPTISVFVTFLQLLASVVLNAIFNVDPLDEVAPVLCIELPTLGLQGQNCSYCTTLGHADVFFKIMIRFKIMIILAFLNAFLKQSVNFQNRLLQIMHKYQCRGWKEFTLWSKFPQTKLASISST